MISSRAAGLAALGVVLLVAAPGCFTVVNLFGGLPHMDGGGLAVYGGVGIHLDMIGGLGTDPSALGWLISILFFVVDLPLSAVADTLTLPITIPFGPAD